MVLQLPVESSDWRLAVILILAGFVLSAVAFRHLPVRVRVLSALLWLAFMFYLLKEGFVRADAGHVEVFFVAAVLAIFAFMPARRDPWVVMGIVALMLLVFDAVDLTGKVRPIDSTRAFFTAARNTTIHRQSDLRDGARAQLQAVYALSPETLGLVRGKSVHIYPFEANVVWAYDLKWAAIACSSRTTRPMRRALTSSTPRRALSHSGPQVVLRRREKAIDGRLQSDEAPLSTMALICGYRQVRADPTAQVLAPAKNRCGPARTIGTTTGRWGQPIPLPPTDPRRPELRFVRLEEGGANRALRSCAGCCIAVTRD